MGPDPNYENWFPNSLWPNIAADSQPANEDDHPNYYDHQELAAQEVMAEATKWIVILTGASLILSAVGAAAIIWTLLESRKVTGAAREANQIMRDEQRPWLTQEMDSTCDFIINNKTNSVDLRWRRNTLNWGRLPAFSVRFHSKIVSFDGYQYHDGINQVINEAIKQAELHPTLVSIFPKEEGQFARNRLRHFVPEIKDSFGLVSIVSYRLENSPNAEFGYDVRFYSIELNAGQFEDIPIDQSILVEHRDERQTT